jgi:hypothetical protein
MPESKPKANNFSAFKISSLQKRTSLMYIRHIKVDIVDLTPGNHIVAGILYEGNKRKIVQKKKRMVINENIFPSNIIDSKGEECSSVPFYH